MKLDYLSLGIVDKYLSVKTIYNLSQKGILYWNKRYKKLFPEDKNLIQPFQNLISESDGTNNFVDYPKQKKNKDFIGYSKGEYHQLGLTNNGYIYAWGNNYYNQCKVPESYQGKFISCSANFHNSFGLTCDGFIITWGKDGHFYDLSSYQGSFISISSKNCYSLGLTKDGFLFGISNNYKTVLLDNAPSEYQGSFIKCWIGEKSLFGYTKNGLIIEW